MERRSEDSSLSSVSRKACDVEAGPPHHTSPPQQGQQEEPPVPPLETELNQAGMFPQQQQGIQPTDWGFELDGEGKARKLKMFQFRSPHVIAFHLSWSSFFASFFASFTMAALTPIVRQNLDLTTKDVAHSGIANVCGGVPARLIIGWVCDVIGPRYGVASVLMLFAPAAFCSSLIKDAGGLITVRTLSGVALCVFVCNQFWSGIMFSPNCVGSVTATCGGWGNLGGGIALLLMPAIYSGMKLQHPGFVAWRWVFMVAGGLMLFLAMCVLMFSQDAPHGSYKEIRRKQPKKLDPKRTFLTGWRNYRTWILALNYGYCFGTELTINNVITAYIFDQFRIDFRVAGVIGAIFGLMNIGSRTIGGLGSDLLGKHFGMPGRLWAYFILQIISGAFSCVLFAVDNSLGGTIGVMIVFSGFVQAAQGGCYGIVPFVSRRSYGVVGGAVGAGGNAGSAVTQALFFLDTEGVTLTTQEGFLWMGVMIMGITVVSVPTLYWPAWGGMLWPAKEGATEEDYFLSEFTPEEIAANLHEGSMKFALASKSMRGKKLLSIFKSRSDSKKYQAKEEQPANERENELHHREPPNIRHNELYQQDV